MKKAQYKVIPGLKGLEEFEKEVAYYLNQGWKPIGGVSFSAGYPYQAIARVIEVNETKV